MTTLWMCQRSTTLLHERLKSNIGESIITREGGCEPGSYSIVDGRIYFPTKDDFNNTVEFLSCASQTDIEDWRDDLQIETSAIALIEFLEATCCDTTATAQDYEEIKEEFEGRVKTWTNGSGEEEVDLKYIFFPEFVNSIHLNTRLGGL